MGVFILIFGGLFWLWKWIEYQAEEEAYRRRGAIIDSYREKMMHDEEKREEERKAEELLCSDVETRIKFIEENILDDITEFFGADWRKIFSNIESYDCSRQVGSPRLPLGIARLFFASRKGCEPSLMSTLYDFRWYRKSNKVTERIKLIQMFKIYERNMQKFYPEIYLVWIPWNKFNSWSREITYCEDLYEGKLWWNFAAPRPCRKWHPKIKTLDELLSELTAVDTEPKT